MIIPRKKICLLFCGGTTIDPLDPAGTSVRDEKDIKGWMDAIAEIRIIADVDPFFIYGGSSTNVDASVWKKVIEEILKRKNEYHGFVVLASLDVTPYMASALSFAFGKVSKPIVFSGTHAPERAGKKLRQKIAEFYKESTIFSLKSNLISAIQAATMDIGEVIVMFGSDLMRATRSKVRYLNNSAFMPDDIFSLGKIDFSFRLNKERLKPVRGTFSASNIYFEDKIAILHVNPAESGIVIPDYSSLKGIFVLNPYPGAVDAFLKGKGAFLTRLDMPAVIYNQNGIQDIDFDYPNIAIINRGFYEPVLVKFMWALGITNNAQNVKKIMEQEYVGEFGGIDLKKPFENLTAV